jgi:hypothetical protein
MRQNAQNTFANLFLISTFVFSAFCISAEAQTCQHRKYLDFDCDNKADHTVYRPSDSNWYILQSTNGARVENFGVATDRLTPGDYDGDGKTDVAVFRITEKVDRCDVRA